MLFSRALGKRFQDRLKLEVFLLNISPSEYLFDHGVLEFFVADDLHKIHESDDQLFVLVLRLLRCCLDCFFLEFIYTILVF